MGQLITDLLSLAHLGRAKMDLAPVDLSEMALRWRPSSARNPGEVDWDIQPGRWPWPTRA